MLKACFGTTAARAWLPPQLASLTVAEAPPPARNAWPAGGGGGLNMRQPRRWPCQHSASCSHRCIHAVSQPSGSGTIREDVAKVSATAHDAGQGRARRSSRWHDTAHAPATDAPRPGLPFGVQHLGAWHPRNAAVLHLYHVLPAKVQGRSRRLGRCWLQPSPYPCRPAPVNRRPERRPPSPAFELLLAAEERQSADGAQVEPPSLAVVGLAVHRPADARVQWLM